MKEELEPTCPFCRKAIPKTEEANHKQWMKRIEANDPYAMCQIGMLRFMEGDYNGAFEYFTKAAALGDIEAHYQLSCLVHNGQGVQKDEKRALQHAEQAAIGGQPDARRNLAVIEGLKGRHDRAVKHFVIAANLGCDKAMKALTKLYKAGRVSKEDFAAVLRSHQAAIDATKSPQREAAEKKLCCK